MPDAVPPPSKTRRKAQMHALQALGERLVDLDPARLAALALPERLVDAIVLARSIRKHEARRRQMQYIGRLMREVEPTPIEARLAEWESGPAADRALHAAAERWRERLLAEPEALDQWRTHCPDDALDALRTLLAQTRAERARGDPPRSFRLVYRHVRDALARRAGDAVERHGAKVDAGESEVEARDAVRVDAAKEHVTEARRERGDAAQPSERKHGEQRTGQ